MNGIADRLTSATTLLQVFDMPRSIAFYRDELGFQLVATSEPGERFDWAMLEGGDPSSDGDAFRLMLNTAYETDGRPAAPDPARVAAHADTTVYFTCDNPDAIYESLRQSGLQPQAPQTAPYGMRQVYLSDPDGYSLCFQKQVLAESAETTP